MGGRIAILLAFVLCCSTSHAEGALEIPLDQIWAYRMPGTRDIRELDETLVDQMLRAVSHKPRDQEIVSSGFVVAGIGKSALIAAHQVLIKHHPPENNFKTSQRVSMVLFSHSSARYFRISEIEVRGSTVSVSYELVPHKTKEVTSHIALIPLGKLPPNKYAVELIQHTSQEAVKAGFPPISDEVARTLVSNSFSFTYQAEGETE